MKESCTRFFREQDQLGADIHMNYRGSPTFGTCVGGFFSMLATVIFTIFTFVQAYSWLFTPSYNQSADLTYIQQSEKDAYTIPTTLFLPTVAFLRIRDDFTVEQVPQYWDYGYALIDYTTGQNTTYGTMQCAEYVKRLDLSDAEKEALIDEMIYPDELICPDFTTFDIRGQQDLKNQYLYFWAKAHDEIIESGDIKR